MSPKAFIHEDFLLDTLSARRLYHEYAEPQPIIDYHCHLPPSEIASDKRWNNIVEIWLGGDHYKWRQLRWNGFPEALCSGLVGEATAFERFMAYAEALERLAGNPLFDWSQLELARCFGVTDRLCRKTAAGIFERCNEVLASDPTLSARGLMKRFNVRVVCTTDDPIDSLEHHLAIGAHPFGVQIRPTWRSDKASKIDEPALWNHWVDALGAAADVDISSYPDFRRALAIRHEFFASAGCVLSDYGIGEVPSAEADEGELERIFAAARSGRQVSPLDAEKFRTAWLMEGLRADAAAGWTAQIHCNCQRNLNSRMFRELGPDTGFDAIGDWSVGTALARLFDALERNGALPRCVVYSLNPKDNELLASVLGSFQSAPDRGKLQLGAAWWFLDQKHGMLRHIETLESLGSLGTFVGMLTDSRSFLSYTRHEYFRRLLCRKLGRNIESGELPADFEWIGGMVADISFGNANRYFGFNA